MFCQWNFVVFDIYEHFVFHVEQDVHLTSIRLNVNILNLNSRFLPKLKKKNESHRRLIQKYKNRFSSPNKIVNWNEIPSIFSKSQVMTISSIFFLLHERVLFPQKNKCEICADRAKPDYWMYYAVILMWAITRREDHKSIPENVLSVD